MKANIVGIDGSSKGTLDLPKVFETEYKPKLIHRAVLAIQSAKKQPKGAHIRAGLQNTALYIGKRSPPAQKRSINTDMARLPRLKNRRNLLSGKVARVPQSVGGRRAHPPKSWKIIAEKINKKEKRQALMSAIAATTMKDLIDKRFIFEGNLPLVVDDSIEQISKTKDVVTAFEKVGVGKDLENAKNKVRRRAGKGKQRGRKKKEKRSVLVVTSKNDKVLKASRNLPGVDAVTVNSLNVELLAPGGEAGRLVVWTKGAIEKLGKEKEKQPKKEPKPKKKIDVRKVKKELRKKLDAKMKSNKKAAPVEDDE